MDLYTFPPPPPAPPARTDSIIPAAPPALELILPRLHLQPVTVEPASSRSPPTMMIECEGKGGQRVGAREDVGSSEVDLARILEEMGRGEGAGRDGLEEDGARINSRNGSGGDTGKDGKMCLQGRVVAAGYPCKTSTPATATTIPAVTCTVSNPPTLPPCLSALNSPAKAIPDIHCPSYMYQPVVQAPLPSPSPDLLDPFMCIQVARDTGIRDVGRTARKSRRTEDGAMLLDLHLFRNNGNGEEGSGRVGVGREQQQQGGGKQHSSSDALLRFLTAAGSDDATGMTDTSSAAAATVISPSPTAPSSPTTPILSEALCSVTAPTLPPSHGSSVALIGEEQAGVDESKTGKTLTTTTSSNNADDSTNLNGPGFDESISLPPVPNDISYLEMSDVFVAAAAAAALRKKPNGQSSDASFGSTLMSVDPMASHRESGSQKQKHDFHQQQQGGIMAPYPLFSWSRSNSRDGQGEYATETSGRQEMLSSYLNGVCGQGMDVDGSMFGLTTGSSENGTTARRLNIPSSSPPSAAACASTFADSGKSIPCFAFAGASSLLDLTAMTGSYLLPNAQATGTININTAHKSSSTGSKKRRRRRSSSLTLPRWGASSLASDEGGSNMRDGSHLTFASSSASYSTGGDTPGVAPVTTTALTSDFGGAHAGYFDTATTAFQSSMYGAGLMSSFSPQYLPPLFSPNKHPAAGRSTPTPTTATNTSSSTTPTNLFFSPSSSMHHASTVTATSSSSSSNSTAAAAALRYLLNTYHHDEDTLSTSSASSSTASSPLSDAALLTSGSMVTSTMAGMGSLGLDSNVGSGMYRDGGMEIRSSSGEGASTMKGGSKGAGGAGGNVKQPKMCANCCTQQTPSWRRCAVTRQLLCNACGL
ncbi:hypothetical protein HK102_007927 [Quaeritorhiza haematococci]|nr:hypothetical protein HK102_007927 [Quaeritorhiza haematococci]